MLTDFIEELFVLGEQLFEPKGLELCLGLAAEGSQRLFDQGVITNFMKKSEKKDDKTQKPLCTSWNVCQTEKKCQYEVDHPGRFCIRKHECSHCWKTLKQSHKHQAWKCPSK